ncbi:protein transport protein SEC20, putative [Plasmodium chabaudi chabaudi]|uniref:Protein transport protein SEC20, putative n=1 Tax=Plasmodium chabaudi chabaudi TaxID=31271 RepID=A0A077TUI6_PLACU|nr:protein transport protein SEC20, putative [Plasmodium chabaudi chabaudi]SCM26049.1 protein transport protein SEC20, putative [Plasmodium chabaudi chabaudi]SCN62807.1 protein transport protein SEC20, putative [Plasmodium chabaudi chabaudi]VTZ70848.1 protein transport protein SEC20, putative [Plasmodium chabaudi chabaudi]|eukprot:XP_016654873.1 protein transport protein SEC20, putative [Plasmodium chabaudi chabaudi]
MDDNFIQNSRKHNKNVENMNKINSIINHMKLMNNNLNDIFSHEQIFSDHDSYLLFRGKVSKRIVDYSQLISNCKDKILDCEYLEDDDEKRINDALEEHLRNLENYKRGLSIWWKKNEKDFHCLCMNNFLNLQKSNDNTIASDKKVDNPNLKDTKKIMIDEINRMKNVRSELLESSQKLKKQNEIFNIFEEKIRSSANLIFSLKKKADSDARYVWYSFFLFLSVCGYIIMRRLGLIRAIIIVLKFLFSVLFYLAKMCIGAFYFMKEKNGIEPDFTRKEDLSKSLVVVMENTEL